MCIRYCYLVLQRGAKAEDMGEGSVLGRPHSVPLGYNSPFSLILLHLEEKRCWTRRGVTFWGIMFWIERLIINSAEELSFGRT